MSTASARQDRQWWSLSSKNLTPSTSCKPGRESSYSFPSTDRQQPRSNSRKHSSGMKFSTLTTAMGFKSRKPSSLVIQERPDIVVPNPPKVDTVRQRNRPPANSISTVQSSDEPIEPRTPLDDVRDSTPTRRRSLLQTPEPDPFSSQGIRGPANIHDPSRLSVYSGSSASDVISKRSDLGISFKRSSYASSSSHSQYLGTDLSPSSSATSLAAGLEGQKGSPTKTSGSHRRKQSLLSPPDATLENIVNLDGNEPYPTLSKQGSSSTLTERNRTNPDLESRPPLRPRGLTDGSSNWGTQSMSQFLRGKAAPAPPKSTSLPPTPNERPTSLATPNRPTRLIRQSSSSRIGPPSAPPAQELPSPPLKELRSRRVQLGQQIRPETSPLSSSSNLSFASATSSNREVPVNQTLSRKMEMDWDRESISSRTSGGRAIRRSISHQALPKRSNFTTSSGPPTPSEVPTDKGPRKQHSSHNLSRYMMPSLPIPNRNQPPIPSPPQVNSPISADTASVTDQQRKGSVASIGVRKRLFSGGSIRQPPSQILSTGEDDHQSLFTSEGEPGLGASFTNPFAQDLAPWDDNASEFMPGSPVASNPEYMPQKIMSPDDLKKLEERFNEESEINEFGSSKRQRVHSFTSISTSMSDRTGLDGLPVSSPSKYSKVVDRGFGARSSTAESGLSSPLRNSLRPSSSQNHMNGFSSTSSSPTRGSFVSSAPSHGLPPPPRPRRQTVNNGREPSNTALSPAPSKRKSANSSFRGQPRSIMKKSSFLDIGDTPQRRSKPPPSKYTGNFLDLDRGKDSIDVVRSDDEQEVPG